MRIDVRSTGDLNRLAGTPDAEPDPADAGPEIDWSDMPEATAGDTAGGPRIRAIADVPLVASVPCAGGEWHIKGLSRQGSIIVLSGYFGSGKTTLVTDIAGRSAAGLSFAGRETAHLPAVYLDRENPQGTVLERFARLGITDSEHFKYWGGWLPEEAPAPGGALLVDYVRSCDPKPVLVFDSMVRFLNGSENDNVEVAKFMRTVRALADLGATVYLLIHASPKDQSRQPYRGATDIPGSIDIGYYVEKLPPDPAEPLKAVSLTCFKSRYLVDPRITLRLDEGAGFQPESGRAVPQARTIPEKLKAVLRQYPGVNQGAFVDHAMKSGVPRAAARKWLHEAELSGVVVGVRGDKNALFFSLADEGWGRDV
jgi:hypothetical protein